MSIAQFIIFFFLLTYIQSYIDNECLSSQECITESSSRIKCSEYGKCAYSYNNVLLSNFATTNAVECKCIRGYTNLSEEAEVKCCYKQKKQLTAFVLEMIFSLGVGHFYSGHTFLGVFKMITISLIELSMIVYSCIIYNEDHLRKGNKNTKWSIFHLIGTIFMFLGCFVFLLWQIVDAVMFGLNLYKDENGIELVPW